MFPNKVWKWWTFSNKNGSKEHQKENKWQTKNVVHLEHPLFFQFVSCKCCHCSGQMLNFKRLGIHRRVFCLCAQVYNVGKENIRVGKIIVKKSAEKHKRSDKQFLKIHMVPQNKNKKKTLGYSCLCIWNVSKTFKVKENVALLLRKEKRGEGRRRGRGGGRTGWVGEARREREREREREITWPLNSGVEASVCNLSQPALLNNINVLRIIKPSLTTSQDAYHIAWHWQFVKSWSSKSKVEKPSSLVSEYSLKSFLPRCWNSSAIDKGTNKTFFFNPTNDVSTCNVLKPLWGPSSDKQRKSNLSFYLPEPR